MYLDPKGEYVSDSDIIHVEYTKAKILQQLRLINEELEKRQLDRTNTHNQIFVVIEEMSALKSTLEKMNLMSSTNIFKIYCLKVEV